MQEGWKCPECGRINAPFLDHCPCKDEICETIKYVPIPNYIPVYPLIYPFDTTPYYTPDYYRVTCERNTSTYSEATI